VTKKKQQPTGHVHAVVFLIDSFLVAGGDGLELLQLKLQQKLSRSKSFSILRVLHFLFLL